MPVGLGNTEGKKSGSVRRLAPESKPAGMEPAQKPFNNMPVKDQASGPSLQPGPFSAQAFQRDSTSAAPKPFSKESLRTGSDSEKDSHANGGVKEHAAQLPSWAEKTEASLPSAHGMEISGLLLQRCLVVAFHRSVHDLQANMIPKPHFHTPVE